MLLRIGDRTTELTAKASEVLRIFNLGVLRGSPEPLKKELTQVIESLSDSQAEGPKQYPSHEISIGLGMKK